MLTHRTNVLFSPQDYRVLAKIAQQDETSIGELVRQAVKKVYIKTDSENGVIEKRVKHISAIKKIGKQLARAGKSITLDEISTWKHEGHQY